MQVHVRARGRHHELTILRSREQADLRNHRAAYASEGLVDELFAT